MVKETKLYDLLSIKPDASQDDVKKGYRKAAMKWHPDKNKNDAGAAEKFKECSQAYEILSDPNKRKIYDTYGLEYLLHGGPPPSAGFDPGAYQSSGGGPGGMPPGGFDFGGAGGPGTSFRFTSSDGSVPRFAFRNAEDIFAEFARTQGSAAGGAEGLDSFFQSFAAGAGAGPRPTFSTRSAGGPKSRSSDPFSGMARDREVTPEITTVEKPLPLSLEELFNGVNKKMKIKRKTFDASGKQIRTDQILEVPIKPGLKKGSKIKFNGVGDQVEGGRQDLHFIVEEKPHALYTREDNDLAHTITLDLKEALTGWKRTLVTIDGKHLPIEKAGPTQPGSEDRYPGHGMPISKKPGTRGDLIVRYAVKFPTSLTATQKEKLREIL